MALLPYGPNGAPAMAPREGHLRRPSSWNRLVEVRCLPTTLSLPLKTGLRHVALAAHGQSMSVCAAYKVAAAVGSAAAVMRNLRGAWRYALILRRDFGAL